MVKTCQSCGGEFETPNDRRKFCTDACRSRNKRAPRGVAKSKGGVVAAVTAELEAAGALSSSQGQAALVLAARLDGQGESSTALATAAKQMAALMAEVCSGKERVSDPVDELAERRKRRLASGS